jgi:hypothetical protein
MMMSPDHSFNLRSNSNFYDYQLLTSQSEATIFSLL